jgi:phosphoglycolate phosphatase
VVEELLVPWKGQGNLDKVIKCLNLDTDLYDTERHYILEHKTVLLIEGVLLFREPLLPYLDGKIFLTISFDEVLNRARVRDVPRYGEEFLNKYIYKYIPVQKRYLEEHKPMDVSDVIIDNTDYRKPVLLKVKLCFIHNRITCLQDWESIRPCST